MAAKPKSDPSRMTPEEWRQLKRAEAEAKTAFSGEESSKPAPRLRMGSPPPKPAVGRVLEFLDEILQPGKPVPVDYIYSEAAKAGIRGSFIKEALQYVAKRWHIERIP